LKTQPDPLQTSLARGKAASQQAAAAPAGAAVKSARAAAPGKSEDGQEVVAIPAEIMRKFAEDQEPPRLPDDDAHQAQLSAESAARVPRWVIEKAAAMRQAAARSGVQVGSAGQHGTEREAAAALGDGGVTRHPSDVGARGAVRAMAGETKTVVHEVGEAPTDAGQTAAAAAAAAAVAAASSHTSAADKEEMVREEEAALAVETKEVRLEQARADAEVREVRAERARAEADAKQVGAGRRKGRSVCVCV